MRHPTLISHLIRLVLIAGFFAGGAARAEMSLTLKARVQQATQAARQGQYSQAVALLNPYTDQLDDNSFLLLANSYSKMKDYTNEVRVLNLIVAKEKKDYRWHMLLAQAYRKRASQISRENQRSEYEDTITSAVTEYRKTMELNPKFKPAFDELLTTFLKHHDDNEARGLVMTGIDKYGQRPELIRELCRLDSNDGYVVQAVTNCKLAIKLAPNYPDDYVYLIQSFHDRDKDQESEKIAVDGARRFPHSEFVQWAAGTFFLKKKNYPVAARYFKAALAAKPDSTRAHFGLAQSLYKEGDQRGALPHYIIACQKDRKTLDAFYVAGSTLKQKGDSTLGQLYTRKAQACDGSN